MFKKNVYLTLIENSNSAAHLLIILNTARVTETELLSMDFRVKKIWNGCPAERRPV